MDGAAQPETPANKPISIPALAIAGACVFIVLVIIVGLIVAGKNRPNSLNSGKDSGNRTLSVTPNVNQDTNAAQATPAGNGELAFLPSQTCPTKLTAVPGQSLSAEYQGKAVMIRGEDMAWVDANCKDAKNGGTSSQGQTGMNALLSAGQCGGKGTVQYTKPLIALEDLGQITPLGRMFDSHVTPTDHQYWQPKNPNAAWSTYPIYAPADATIVSIERTPAGQSQTTDQKVTIQQPEFRIVMEHTCDFYTILIHLHTLDESIAKQVTFNESTNRPSSPIRIAVKAGQKLATVGGNTFDVTTSDSTKKLTGFVNPATYNQEPWKVYTNDTISYYSDAYRSQLYAKVSRSAAPVGGMIDYDVDGKLSGNWYRQGSGGYSGNMQQRYWDGHLAFAPNPFDGKTILVSTGHYLGATSAQFAVDPATPDPAKIGPENGLVKIKLYDYKLMSNGTEWNATTPSKNVVVQRNGGVKATLLVQMQLDKTIKVEFVKGDSNQASFTSSAMVYER